VAPDVILLDLNMPVLDGQGFITAYRREPGPRALLAPMSATVDAAHWAELADAFLAKPFDLDAVLALVRDLVRRAARARDKTPSTPPAAGPLPGPSTAPRRRLSHPPTQPPPSTPAGPSAESPPAAR
jgi:DNA-binding response OmpR family regulator